MPTFSQIELFLDRSYSKEEQKSFIFKSRCICNYLERALAEKEYETTLSRVNIYCSKQETEVRCHPLKGAPYLEVCIKYNLPLLSNLEDALLQAHYTRILDLGLRSAEKFMSIPRDYCMSILKKFENEGFKNEWIQAQKSWKEWSVRCEVAAQLTMKKFTLSQRIYFGDELMTERLVAETKPREMLFIDYLGTLSLDRAGNIFYKRKGKTLTQFHLERNSEEGTISIVELI